MRAVVFLDAAGGWCWSGYFIVFFVRAVLHGGGRVISPHVTVCARRAVLLLDVGGGDLMRCCPCRAGRNVS